MCYFILEIEFLANVAEVTFSVELRFPVILGWHNGVVVSKKVLVLKNFIVIVVINEFFFSSLQRPTAINNELWAAEPKWALQGLSD